MNPVNAGSPAAATIIGLLIGCLLGWSARTTTADHRYIRALAERHEAQTTYYFKATDELIQQNKADIAKERKTNGQKKN